MRLWILSLERRASVCRLVPRVSSLVLRIVRERRDTSASLLYRVLVQSVHSGLCVEFSKVCLRCRRLESTLCRSRKDAGSLFDSSLLTNNFEHMNRSFIGDHDSSASAEPTPFLPASNSVESASETRVSGFSRKAESLARTGLGGSFRHIPSIVQIGLDTTLF